MEPTMRAFGMTWKEQPGVGGMIHHPIKLNNKQVMYATKNITPYPTHFVPLFGLSERHHSPAKQQQSLYHQSLLFYSM